jgi:hypothetical protein
LTPCRGKATAGSICGMQVRCKKSRRRGEQAELEEEERRQQAAK